MTAAPLPRPVRVAIYTRKSVTDGLDQAFNSLDAQRAAIEAYVKSQVGLGWSAIDRHYDDGGFSGSTVDRPAFQELLRDVEARRVDVVAVYKIDRLSRSLRDFAKLMDLFERNGVTFVSVTQQFSTSNSLGRLTLNILMSFAEFERETTAERIRDKVRATRRRGSWTGGRPVLGYDVVDQKLVVNADEAQQLRGTYELYLERGSIRDTIEELRRRGWRNKTFTTKKKTVARGQEFTKATLHKLLTNTLYTGHIRAGSELVPGAHERLVTPELWDAVQQQLRSNGRNGGASARNKTGAILRGLLRCGRCGSGMTHTFTTRENMRHRYYVCMRLHNEGPKACPGSRVPAGKFEAFVVNQIRRIGGDHALLAKTAAAAASSACDRLDRLEGELKWSEQERRRLEGERTDLLRTPPSEDRAQSVRDRVATIAERLNRLDRRRTEICAEHESLRNSNVRDDLKETLTEFLPVWEHLFPAEQERILRLLIEHVTYEPDTKDASIDLRACGIAALAEEARAT